MPEPAIALPNIVSLSMPAVDPTPTLTMAPIVDLPTARNIVPLNTAMPQVPSDDWNRVPSATVDIVDRAPVIAQANTGVVPPSRFQPLPTRGIPAPTPWWKDPMKLGMAAAGLVLLVLLLKKE